MNWDKEYKDLSIEDQRSWDAIEGHHRETTRGILGTWAEIGKDSSLRGKEYKRRLMSLKTQLDELYYDMGELDANL